MSDRQRFAVLISALLAMLLGALDMTVVSAALPQIAVDLGGLANLSWVVTAYLLTSTATVPLYGKLSDLYGRRMMMVIAIIIFVAGSVLCGVAQTMWQLVGARAIQGLGGGALIVLVQIVMADLYSPRERGRYQAFVSAVWVVAALAGPLVGGVLTDSVGWRWIFFINIPLGALALAGIVTQMKMPFTRHEHRIDVAGAITLTAAITCLLLFFVWGGSTYDWASAQIVLLGTGATVLAIAFVLVEQRASEPVLPLSLFHDRNVVVSNAVMMLFGGIFFPCVIYTALFAQGVLSTSATMSGALLLPLNFAWISTAILVGYVVARTGRYRIFPVAGSALIFVGLVQLTRLDASSTTIDLIVATTFLGFGFGAGFQTLLVALQNTVHPSMVGTATAVNHLSRSLGSVVALGALGSVLTVRLAHELQAELGAAAQTLDPELLLRSPETAAILPPQLVHGVHVALAHSLQTVFYVTVPMAVLAFVGTLLLKELPLRTTAPAGSERLVETSL